ncbi:16S rRNA (adenine(1518)-N(6)/adenine(1519)-N(6))-dimethyltransferase RsmA [Oculatella sp. LEGE 06141]|nr:16S rRNA (adenine(1518)-N(6)/adenine(1519)-N(6))-dimethyltransferase RsmA [Oculatella sp. LEGE 06141]
MPKARKQFGQHWLRSETVLQRIVAAAALSEHDRILEIGPGTGLLTRQLLPLVQTVVAVEIDRDLCKFLRQQFSTNDRFVLIEGDILSLDLAKRLSEITANPRLNKVVANIPYNITGPILEKLLGTIASPTPDPFDAIVLLVQKEVAERLCAAPGSKVYGALSVRVQYLATCEWICVVPAKAFHPAPKVDSAVVRLQPRPFHPAVLDPAQLATLVKLGFATRRKMLRNNLSSLVERDRLTDFLEQHSLNPQARAEELGVANWVALSDWLTKTQQP